MKQTNIRNSVYIQWYPLPRARHKLTWTWMARSGSDSSFLMLCIYSRHWPVTNNTTAMFDSNFYYIRVIQQSFPWPTRWRDKLYWVHIAQQRFVIICIGNAFVTIAQWFRYMHVRKGSRHSISVHEPSASLPKNFEYLTIPSVPDFILSNSLHLDVTSRPTVLSLLLLPLATKPQMRLNYHQKLKQYRSLTYLLTYLLTYNKLCHGYII